MNTINIVEDNLPGFRGQACLVQNEETREFFVVSTVIPHISEYDGDFETLAFRSDEEGNITDWLEVAGGRNMTTSEVIEALSPYDEDAVFDPSMFGEDEWEDFVREDDTLLP